MPKRRPIPGRAILLTVITVVITACSVVPPQATQSSAQHVPTAASYPVMPYAASDPDHPAMQAWAGQFASQQAALRNSHDLQQTSWLFRRDNARLITVGQRSRGECVPRFISAEASLLPPPPLSLGGATGLSFGQRSVPSVATTFIQSIAPNSC